MPSPRHPRIVVVGDVGAGSTLHVGDEAMTETAVDELRRRGLDDLVLLSRNPEDTRARYGVASIERIGFAGLDHDAVMARLDRVLRLLEGDGDALPPDDPAHTVIRTVHEADAVLIAGGGNITTLYAEHLAERAAVGAIAARAGIPLVIGGQSLGPDFSVEDSVRVAALLDTARLTAAREPGSSAL
ncbi:MAG: polysaccharide pyruvyl transferase family protein, partial [Yonghaparkia sp.]|nr:polysaccharide pyruvyl transferase family protein [Microcella sp.]